MYANCARQCDEVRATEINAVGSNELSPSNSDHREFCKMKRRKTLMGLQCSVFGRWEVLGLEEWGFWEDSGAAVEVRATGWVSSVMI